MAQRESARFKVTVKPKSSRREVFYSGQQLEVRVTVPPVEGKANKMCLEMIAKSLGIAKSRLSIVGGERSREKIVQIKDISQKEAIKRLRKDLD